MGGKALKNFTSVRLQRREYYRMADACVERLTAAMPSLDILALGSYRLKADFGDCDILISSAGYDPMVAANALKAVEVVRNGPVTSCGVVIRPEIPHLDGNVFQVDLIKIDPAAFNFAAGYFGAADTGNLVGRIAHAQGLAFRHDGLYYYCRNGDYKFAEILLTQEYSRALEFMGYDPLRYAQGFNTVEDIFEFVASTPFFNRDIFLLENRNNKSRVRDKKRPVYMQFLQWCERNPGFVSYPYPEDKSAWFPRIGEFFPHFPDLLEKANAGMARLQQVREKYNGEFVGQLTGLQGAELGAVMRSFRESFDSVEDMNRYILEAPQDAMRDRIIHYSPKGYSGPTEATSRQRPKP